MNSPLHGFLPAACGALALLAGLAFGQQDPGQAEGPPPITIQPITLDVLLIKGGLGANSGLIVGGREIIAVDAKMSPESIQAMIAEVKKTIPFPVTRIILTHSDADHVNGLPGFPKGLTIISQEQTRADMVKAAAETPALADYLPTQVFKDEMKITSGRQTIVLRHFGPAHTSGDTVVFVDSVRTAFVGDLVFVGRDPIIHRAKGGSTTGLLKTLRALLDHRPHVDDFIPGHGDLVTRGEVENLIRTIEMTRAKVRTFIQEGKTLEEIKKLLQVDTRPSAAGARFPSLAEVIYLELTEAKDKK